MGQSAFAPCFFSCLLPVLGWDGMILSNFWCFGPWVPIAAVASSASQFFSDIKGPSRHAGDSPAVPDTNALENTTQTQEHRGSSGPASVPTSPLPWEQPAARFLPPPCRNKPSAEPQDTWGTWGASPDSASSPPGTCPLQTCPQPLTADELQGCRSQCPRGHSPAESRS